MADLELKQWRLARNVSHFRQSLKAWFSQVLKITDIGSRQSDYVRKGLLCFSLIIDDFYFIVWKNLEKPLKFVHGMLFVCFLIF